MKFCPVKSDKENLMLTSNISMYKLNKMLWMEKFYA